MNKTILTIMSFCFCISAFPQIDFITVAEGLTTVAASSLLKKKGTAKLKTIEFPTQGYTITGYIANGALSEGTNAQFFDISSPVPTLLLDGKVAYVANRLVIDGIRYCDTPSGNVKIHGTFYVCNMDDFSMNYKTKKAGTLRIQISEVKTFYVENGPAISMNLKDRDPILTSCPMQITLSRDNGELIYTVEHNNSQPKTRQILYVRDNETLSGDDIFSIRKIYENCRHARWMFGNGDYFEGTIVNVIKDDTITSTATAGVMNYANGDRFEGNVSAKTIGPFFIEGTTYFDDGTSIKGNWLSEYTLPDYQWAKIYEQKNPSSARLLAERFVKDNERQKKQAAYNALVEQVKALGETKYQKALKLWRNRFLKRIENECWVSGSSIMGSIMVEGVVGEVTNKISITTSLAPVILEATRYRPTALKTIIDEMTKEVEKDVIPLALPIELELEKQQEALDNTSTRR